LDLLAFCRHIVFGAKARVIPAADLASLLQHPLTGITGEQEIRVQVQDFGQRGQICAEPAKRVGNMGFSILVTQYSSLDLMLPRLSHGIASRT